MWQERDFIALGLSPVMGRGSPGGGRPGPRARDQRRQRPYPPRGRPGAGPGAVRAGPARGGRPGCPWVPPGRVYSAGVVGLHEEVEDFYQYISPTPEEHQMRITVFQAIRDVIVQLWKHAKVFVFGSFETGMYLPTSDIDMVALGRWTTPPLEMLKEALLRANICTPDGIKVIDKASVPIIKLTDAYADVRVDISFNMTNGLVSANQIKRYVALFPHMTRLVMLLKQMLHVRELNEVFRGGVGSYSLILMVVSFLQTHERPASLFPGCNLGVLLLEFLELYGVKFNYDEVCIRVKTKGYAPRQKMEQQFVSNMVHSSPLSIEDPNNPTNDLGRSSYNMTSVKDAFAFAYHRLSRDVLQNRRDGQSLLSSVVRVSERTVNYRRWIRDHYPAPPDSDSDSDQEEQASTSVERTRPEERRPSRDSPWQRRPHAAGHQSRRSQFDMSSRGAPGGGHWAARGRGGPGPARHGRGRPLHRRGHRPW